MSSRTAQTIPTSSLLSSVHPSHLVKVFPSLQWLRVLLRAPLVCLTQLYTAPSSTRFLSLTPVRCCPAPADRLAQRRSHRQPDRVSFGLQRPYRGPQEEGSVDSRCPPRQLPGLQDRYPLRRCRSLHCRYQQ